MGPDLGASLTKMSSCSLALSLSKCFQITSYERGIPVHATLLRPLRHHTIQKGQGPHPEGLRVGVEEGTSNLRETQKKRLMVIERKRGGHQDAEEIGHDATQLSLSLSLSISLSI